MPPLHRKALRGLLFLFLAMSALVFIPAGTFAYWQAWTFLSLYFAASIGITLYLMRNDPDLLARRIHGGPTAEREPVQKRIMAFLSPGFAALLVLPALDHRFAWSHLPPIVALAGDLLVLLGWFGIFAVFRQNTFSSSIIETAPGQKVITTGLYAHIRHPMYATALLMLAGIPIALGSLWGLLVIAIMLPGLIWRILAEENFLARNLPGYAEYRQRVRFRLLPWVW
jgi:protein-S-isoprenylcysteine O-methyltransferase Ste14